jgi:hypothetical protein
MHPFYDLDDVFSDCCCNYVSRLHAPTCLIARPWSHKLVLNNAQGGTVIKKQNVQKRIKNLNIVIWKVYLWNNWCIQVFMLVEGSMRQIAHIWWPSKEHVPLILECCYRWYQTQVSKYILPMEHVKYSCWYVSSFVKENFISCLARTQGWDDNIPNQRDKRLRQLFLLPIFFIVQVL